MDAAVKHCTAGIGIWEWASNDGAASRTWSWPAAATCRRWRRSPPSTLLREHLPELKVRVINVVDLMRLQPASEHPHGLSDKEFDTLFTTDKPIIFAFHGYPWLIHRLTYRRPATTTCTCAGTRRRGTTTTPFDMAVRNDLDRFHLAEDVIDRVPKLGASAAYVKQEMRDKLVEHHALRPPARRRHARDQGLEVVLELAC